jgi:hypothetical protein
VKEVMPPGNVIQAPELSRRPFLFHGFGNRHFHLNQLKRAGPGFEHVLMRQVHSDTIYRLEAAPKEPPSGDACITSIPGLLLIIQTADCLPLLMTCPERKVIGAGHCGWKGTAKGLAAKLAENLMDEFGCRREKIISVLGPCIQADHYQVGEEVLAAFHNNGQNDAGFITSSGRLFLDLKHANQVQLESAGLQNIFSVGSGTYSQSHMYSYRRDGDSAGRMLSYIGIKKKTA